MPDQLMQEIVMGNALDEIAALPENSIDTIITEPPRYQKGLTKGLPQTFWGDGWKGRLGEERHVGDYITHLVEVFAHAHNILKDKGSLWVILQDTFSGETLYGIPAFLTLYLLEQGWFLKNQIIWQHEKALIRHAGQRFTENYKTILFLVKDPAQHYYEKQEEKSGRLYRTVWFGSIEDILPIMIQASCPRDGIVLDPFCGEGSTCVGACRLQRSYVGIDLDPKAIARAEAELEPLKDMERLF